MATSNVLHKTEMVLFNVETYGGSRELAGSWPEFGLDNNIEEREEQQS